MKFNPNQRYTRWSIRRLSVGVASVVVASGFFVLVGQPSSVHADVVNPTPAQVVPDATSVSEKSDLPVEVLKAAVDTALPSEQAESTPKASLDTASSPEKADAGAKEPVVAPKEEVQAKPESKKQTEDAVKPVASPAPKVSGQDREASEAQPATTPDEVQKGVADNTKDTVDVPAGYLEKATASGPFLAGVNQVIPYEAFGGDGMLTRLLLKASATAPWSDNGSANHAPLLPLDKLAKGQYFYQVELDGNASGKQGQDLLEQLRANGTHTYTATIKVYGSKDGQADLTNVIATRQVKLNLNGIATSSSKQNGRPTLPSVSNHRKPDKGMDSGKMHLDKQMDQGTMKKDSQKPNNQVRATSKHAADGKTKQKEKSMLPYTGESKTSMAIIGIFGLALAGLLGSFGLKGRREEN